MSYLSEVLADSPLLYWRLDENPPGTGTAADTSGNGRTGTYVASPTSVTGLVPSDSDAAVSFDGSSQWVNATYNPFSTGVTRTFECWLVRDATTTADAFFGSTSAANPVIVRFDSGANTISMWTDGGQASQTWVGPFAAATTLYIAITYDGTAKQATLWVNAISQGVKTFSTDFNGTPGNLTVAKRGSGQDPFDGTIDEFAVYGTDIGSARISAHYSAGITLVSDNQNIVTGTYGRGSC